MFGLKSAGMAALPSQESWFSVVSILFVNFRSKIIVYHIDYFLALYLNYVCVGNDIYSK